MWWTGSIFLKELTPEPIEPTVTKKKYCNKMKKINCNKNNSLVFIILTRDCNFVNCVLHLRNYYLHILRVVSYIFFLL